MKSYSSIIISKQLIIIYISFALISLSIPLFAQPETMAWGNVIGYRVDGELINFETSIRMSKNSWQESISTAKEKQKPHFSRNGESVLVKSKLEHLSLEKRVENLNDNSFSIDVKLTSDSTKSMEGAFFCIELPESEYSDAEITLISPSEERSFDMPTGDWSAIREWMRSRYNPIKASGALIKSENRTIEIQTADSTDIIVLKGNPYWGNPNTEIYFAVILGNSEAGQESSASYKFSVDAKIDKTPIKVTLDFRSPGKQFDGIGGNFRLQNPFKDPQVIEYCLENLNITWGRVEMPWANWHVDQNSDPLEMARIGKLSQGVEQAMEMAQKLAQQDIPVIVSAWRAPDWAIVGERIWGLSPDGLRGNPLDKTVMRSIAKSIASYILFLKERYGVEAEMFSFNESDLGIYVRQTGAEHAELIKTLGKEFASLGLSTKVLLGDNSDANTYSFVNEALNDPETHKYIGAVSFHSWRGCDNWTLSIWNDIASQVNVPLLVGEGSTDAAAHSYPDIFLESSYALNEIDIYLRILNICEAKSILQWQLTSDYSILTGDGIYDTKGSMKPTQRFWQLKQLGQTPKGSFNLPIVSDNQSVNCAAFGDIKNEVYSLHFVNNGTSRNVKLNGLPNDLSKMKILVTNSTQEMDDVGTISVSNGNAEFEIPATSFVTLISK